MCENVVRNCKITPARKLFTRAYKRKHQSGGSDEPKPVETEE